MTANLKSRAQQIHDRLLTFYGKPVWRTPLPAIDELVSTILSQATSDLNRDKGFDALKANFKDWEAVRDAPTGDVIRAITPAGLANQKGPRIQQVLRDITALTGGLDIEFLREYTPQQAIDWLVQFKGVGRKTASIVLQFSLDLPAFPVDTHVYRVSGRLGLRPEKMSADAAHEHLEALFDPKTYYDGHLNIIHLGREICQARTPRCADCPINHLCDYYAAQLTAGGTA